LDQRLAPKKRRRRWLPTALMTVAVLLAASGAISYVFAPSWFGRGTGEPDVGAVPTVQGRLVNYIWPNEIQIPKLHAKAPIEQVTTENRELQIPLNPKIVGWWNGGAKPGARTGTAVIAGHINYSGVTGVMSQIGTLKPGDKVYVSGTRDKQRKTLAFRITAVRTYEKKAFPYQQIFDQHSVGRLALVTCGGPFDASTGNYLDNIVAYAVVE
jgi:LPXTG-site transpeptidase (sortase) family protein